MSTPTPPQGHPDEISLESKEDLEALAAEMASERGDDGGDAPWADGAGAVGAGDLPAPPKDETEPEPASMPRSVEGVGDLVADPLSRATVIPRDDPGGPAADEVPPSPS